MIYKNFLLRAFNQECDDLVSKVKYTNFDTSLDRMKKVQKPFQNLGQL